MNICNNVKSLPLKKRESLYSSEEKTLIKIGDETLHLMGNKKIKNTYFIGTQNSSKINFVKNSTGKLKDTSFINLKIKTSRHENIINSKGRIFFKENKNVDITNCVVLSNIKFKDSINICIENSDLKDISFINSEYCQIMNTKLKQFKITKSIKIYLYSIDIKYEENIMSTVGNIKKDSLAIIKNTQLNKDVFNCLHVNRNSYLKITNSKFENIKKPLKVSNSDLVISNTTLKNCNIGIYPYKSRIHIKDSKFSDNVQDFTNEKSDIKITNCNGLILSKI